MSLNSIQVIQTILQADIVSQRKSKSRRRPPVVTVSRGYGCGGSKTAKILAKRLKVPLYDDEIIEAVARSAKVDPYLMEQLDEKVKKLKDAIVLSFVTGQSAFPEDYRRHLVNVILGIARTGGVIVGRGANFVLANQRCFRARIVGSPQKCAARLADKKKISLEEAQKLQEDTEKERAEYTRKLFNRDVNEPEAYDLILSSENFSPKQMSHIILGAMKKADFDIG